MIFDLHVNKMSVSSCCFKKSIFVVPVTILTLEKHLMTSTRTILVRVHKIPKVPSAALELQTTSA